MEMSIPVLLISTVLFLVLFFGIGFLLNMLLRMSWIMTVIYPFVAIAIIQDGSFIDYFRTPKPAFRALLDNIVTLAAADIIILISGLIGAVLSGVVMKLLRAKGYQMF